MPKENLWGYFKIRHAFKWSNNMSFLGLIIKLENNFIFLKKKKYILLASFLSQACFSYMIILLQL